MLHPNHDLSASRRRGWTRTRLAALLIIGAGLAVGACGTVSNLTTGRAISQSVSRIGDQSSVSLRFSLGVDPSQAKQLSTKGGGTPMTSAEATALATGSIFFSEQTGHGEALNSKQAATDSANAVDVGLQIGSDVPLEIRYVQQAVYARVNLTQLLSDTGQDPSKAASFAADLSAADQYVPGIGQLGQGNWVKVTPAGVKSISGLINQYAASMGGGTAQPNRSQVRSTLTSLRQNFVNDLENNSTYQNLGTTNGRTKYGVTVKVHGFLDQFGPQLQTDLNTLPGGLGTKAGNALKQAENKIPANQTAVLNLYVQNNKVSEVTVDLNQFAGKDKMSFPVPLQLGITTPPAITAPSGATTLDLSKLPQLISGLLGGLTHTSSGSGASA